VGGRRRMSSFMQMHEAIPGCQPAGRGLRHSVEGVPRSGNAPELG
jgi:hypothetical protein